jgi:hypothetical protein
MRTQNFMPLELAYRGHLDSAYRKMGSRPSRIFVELALLGGVPADSAKAAIDRWILEGRAQSFYALPWLAEHGDSGKIAVLIQRADSASRTGTSFAQRGARYRGMAARAYLSLARRDTADALKRFTALPDTLCIACYVDRYYAAKLLAGKKKYDDADKLLSQRINTLITPMEILIAFERATILEQNGNSDEALRAYRQVASAWATADPVLQHYVDEAKRGLARLGGG